MNKEEYISQSESAKRLHVSYKRIVSLSEQFPDKLPHMVKEGRKQFFFKASDVHSFKKYLSSQKQPKKGEANLHFLTQRDRLRNGFVFKDGQWCS